ncbi:EpsG family protein [Alcanivorax sp.]|uniref:EpsG family protein n=1 Tax=Alcanivorax sp. TaxID=1872427 RepID=UPI0025BE5BC0|nr:EpsG family protein [Alcanivorax sp.]
MLPYWLFFLLPAVVIMVNQPANARTQRLVWGLITLFFTLAIGMRDQVGGDWFAYKKMLLLDSAKSPIEVLSGGDPGYHFLSWVVALFSGSIYWVNTVCGLILMLGVARFSRALPLPWLALLVAVPYLIIVVGMGYTRQAAALGFVMLGLVALGNKHTRSFVVWTILGATFHKSAVLMLPVAALASTSNRFWSFFWAGVITLLAAYFFVFDSADHLWENYVEADYESQGGLIRVLMNAVPAGLFLLFCRRLGLDEAQQKLWFWMAALSMVCIPLVVLSSTATDRVALYLIPIQLFVFAHLPFVAKVPHWRGAIALGVVAYYALVQFVWLVFANHAFAWLPYRVFWLN